MFLFFVSRQDHCAVYIEFYCFVCPEMTMEAHICFFFLCLHATSAVSQKERCNLRVCIQKNCIR